MLDSPGSGDRLILLIGQNVDGHEIDRRGELRGLQPGLSNVGIGDGTA
jgi:hypothetical protein